MRTRGRKMHYNPPTDIPMEKDICFLAGFWEGEGCIHFTIEPKQLFVNASQSRSNEVLERFKRFYGGDIYGPYETKYTKKDGNNSSIYRWEIRHPQLISRFIRDIWPLLTEERKDQIRNEFAKFGPDGMAAFVTIFID